MIITEYETATVWSHKDLEITPTFLAEMTNYLHDETNVPADFVITEDMIRAWAEDDDGIPSMTIMRYNDGTTYSLTDWIHDYMVDYFNDYVLNAYIDDRTYDIQRIEYGRSDIKKC